MKKFLCVFFSVFFMFSCLAVGASADDVSVNVEDIGSQESHVACDYCGALFTTQAQYTEHMKDCCKFANGGLGIKCCACNQYFTTYSMLTSHEDNRTGYEINNKGYIVCENADNGCDETFDSVEAYKAHVDSCVYESFWTLLKAGELEDAFDLVPWSDIWSGIKKVIEFVKGIDLSGVGDTLKSVFNTVKDLLGKVDWSGLLEKVKGLISK